MAALIILAVIAAVVVWLVMIFNGLVRIRNQASNALAQIDVQLKRRHDLIPNLVETAKGYMAHESSTLEAVIEARNQARKVMEEGSHSPDDGNYMNLIAKAEGMLSKALGNFYAVAENYPELKADSVVKDLFDEITNTENRIGFARQHYNDSVMFYNNQREVFPNNFISGTFGFRPMQSLDFADKSAIIQAPKVQLS
ncbi:MAG: LemA family protein [Moraxella sp.]|nr:LemA family protein [Moraxella sp.]